MITIDFETDAIQGNPLLSPPVPRGVAIWRPDQEPRYEAITDDVCKELRQYWAEEDLLFHNAPFDLRVAQVHLGLAPPEWRRVHDTTYLVFLENPHAPSLGLKESAERILGIPPDEQEDIKAWVIQNVPEAKASNWGAWIASAPIELLAPYATGDVKRTRKLYDALIEQYGGKAYDRERQLSPILVAATVRGVPIDRQALERAYGPALDALHQGENAVRTLLGQGAEFNPHSGPELAKALDEADAVTGWDYTAKGNRRTAKESLLKHIKDPSLLHHLEYISTMQTITGTFMGPWLEKSKVDGRIHPNWNQVRQPSERGSKFKGTRTGRLSSDDPNLQNVIDTDRYQLEIALPPMPYMRRFVVPEEGHEWLKRDFSGQEMRILAHFEEGQLYDAYRENPLLDPHGMVQQLIKQRLGKEYPRKNVKETGFGIIYGMGAFGLSNKLHCSQGEAKELIDAYKLVLPGVGKMQQGTKSRGRSKKPILTWGGRPYMAEEAKIINNAYRSFEYKLLNYLIQGSAADQTKQCIIDWDVGKGSSVFQITVHDEINISAPREHAKEAMEWLRACMDQDYFDVPMRSDSFKGPNWADLEEFEI